MNGLAARNFQDSGKRAILKDELWGSKQARIAQKSDVFCGSAQRRMRLAPGFCCVGKDLPGANVSTQVSDGDRLVFPGGIKTEKTDTPCPSA
jgi:hypothetical protein